MRADFLIVGSGIAGLRAAVELADAGRVLILTKAEPAEGNTGYAQGGIAAALGAGDSADLHAADTIAAGDGLCDPHAVQVLVEEGPAYVRELIAWGARFDRDGSGDLAFTLEGAHSARRVLHVQDATGREIARTLWRRICSHPHVAIAEHARVVDLCAGRAECRDVRFLAARNRLATARAASVLLATGGAGQVYSDTTNPPVATGDGLAMAYRAGAAVADLEFVQFHPTALRVPGQPRFLLSEALRGEGARLINEAGDSFTERYDPRGDLAPRDRVARAIEEEVRRTGRPVYLSLAHLDGAYVRRRFPSIDEACRRAGYDLARDPVPVGPAAHYLMGGVVTDLDGRTTIPGLFAAGEVACTGVHGANRLASNSLLEGLVFGARAGRRMRMEHASRGAAGARGEDDEPPAGRSVDLPSAAEIQRLMWEHAGLFRDRIGLETALATLEPAWRVIAADGPGGVLLDPETWHRASLVTVGRLIARAALRRRESRGAHFRADHPDRDDIHWNRRVTDAWEGER